MARGRRSKKEEEAVPVYGTDRKGRLTVTVGEDTYQYSKLQTRPNRGDMRKGMAQMRRKERFENDPGRDPVKSSLTKRPVGSRRTERRRAGGAARIARRRNRG